jgi:hypothetical protein
VKATYSGIVTEPTVVMAACSVAKSVDALSPGSQIMDLRLTAMATMGPKVVAWEYEAETVVNEGPTP